MPLLLGALMVLLWVGGGPVRAALMLDRAAIADGEVWRLATAHLVHLNGYHLLLNLAALGLYVLLCMQYLTWRRWLLRISVLALGLGIALYLLYPNTDRYAGFSGVAHGLFLLGLWPLVRAGDRVALAALLVLVAKLAWEGLFGPSMADAEAIGGRVATEAHLLGVVIALAYGSLLEWRWRSVPGH